MARKRTFSCGTNAGNPERARKLPARAPLPSMFTPARPVEPEVLLKPLRPSYSHELVFADHHSKTRMSCTGFDQSFVGSPLSLAKHDLLSQHLYEQSITFTSCRWVQEMFYNYRFFHKYHDSIAMFVCVWAKKLIKKSKSSLKSVRAGSTIGISHRFFNSYTAGVCNDPNLYQHSFFLDYYLVRCFFFVFFFQLIIQDLCFRYRTQEKKLFFCFVLTFFTSPYYSVFYFSAGDSFLLEIWPPSLFVYSRGFNVQFSLNFLLLKPLLSKVE